MKTQTIKLAALLVATLIISAPALAVRPHYMTSEQMERMWHCSSYEGKTPEFYQKQLADIEHYSVGRSGLSVMNDHDLTTLMMNRAPKVQQWCAEQREKNIKALALVKLPGVRLGMTKKQVLSSNWNEPDEINKTTTEHGTTEQWVYEHSKTDYLYFTNGKLTGIQD